MLSLIQGILDVAMKGGCLKTIVSFAFPGEDANVLFQAVAALHYVFF